MEARVIMPEKRERNFLSRVAMTAEGPELGCTEAGRGSSLVI